MQCSITILCPSRKYAVVAPDGVTSGILTIKRPSAAASLSIKHEADKQRLCVSRLLLSPGHLIASPADITKPVSSRGNAILSRPGASAVMLDSMRHDRPSRVLLAKRMSQLFQLRSRRLMVPRPKWRSFYRRSHIAKLGRRHRAASRRRGCSHADALVAFSGMSISAALPLPSAPPVSSQM